jgi:hypothetical protein
VSPAVASRLSAARGRNLRRDGGGARNTKPDKPLSRTYIPNHEEPSIVHGPDVSSARRVPEVVLMNGLDFVARPL